MSTFVNSLLIPYTPVNSILIPKELIECVLPYAKPLPSIYGHKALVGSLIYKDAKIPVLNLMHLDGVSRISIAPKDGYGKHRIVMVSCISENSFCDSYGIIASSPPSLLKIAAENMVTLNSKPSPFFYSDIKLNLGSSKKLSSIPNLEKLEKELFSVER